MAFFSPNSSNQQQSSNNRMVMSDTADNSRKFFSEVVSNAAPRETNTSAKQNQKGRTASSSTKKQSVAATTNGRGLIHTISMAQNSFKHGSSGQIYAANDAYSAASTKVVAGGKKNQSQTPAPMRKQGSDDLSYKKQAIHDVYKQYAQLKQIRDGVATSENAADNPLSIQKVQSQKLLVVNNNTGGGDRGVGRKKASH